VINQHPEFQVVKRFAAMGPFRDWVSIPFFPTGFAVLWQHNRDESVIGNRLKEIDLISIDNRNGVSAILSEYKTLFPLLGITGTIHKPILSFNYYQWRIWRTKLKNAKVWIFEAKTSKGSILQALGQIITYRELFHKDYPETEIAGCGIVSETSCEADVLTEETCKDLNVEIFRI
jgi:hypothetical protein